MKNLLLTFILSLLSCAHLKSIESNNNLRLNYNGLTDRIKWEKAGVSLPNYERRYEEIELISSSERIDSVISKLTNIKRSDIDTLISKKNITLNYNTLTNKSYVLKEDDIFSVRGYGKYKYIGFCKQTKKGNLVLKILKYI